MAMRPTAMKAPGSEPRPIAALQTCATRASQPSTAFASRSDLRDARAAFGSSLLLGVCTRQVHSRVCRGVFSKPTKGSKRLLIKRRQQAPQTQDALLQSQQEDFRQQLATAWLDEAETSEQTSESSTESHGELLHVHVGAGKIGLGLVLKTLVARKEAYVVLQRGTSKWQEICKSGSVCIRVNGQEVASLQLVSNVEELRVALAGVANAKADGALPNGIIIISKDPAIMTELVTRATSYSMAVGGNRMEDAFAPLARALREVQRKAAHEDNLQLPPLFCCENDHDSVHHLGMQLSGAVNVLPVLVDRVCASLEPVGEGQVEVRTEPFEGDIVIPPSPSLSTLPVPLEGSNVHEPSTELGAEFLHRKKLLTVNGTHTTLAFLTLIEKEPETVGPPRGSHELLKFDVFGALMFQEIDSAGRDCWVWLVARLLMLVTEYSEEIVCHTMAKNTTFGRLCWHQVAASRGETSALVEGLLHEARTALQRLSGGGDETSRVLGGGIDNRYATRLANVAEYFQACDSFTPLQEELLAAADVSEVELRSRVEHVVRESSRFVSDRTLASEVGENTRWGLTPKKPRAVDVALSGVAVLFDFDGTLANTELPAMEVAFWSLAPYMPSLVDASHQEMRDACAAFVLERAGSPFQDMIEECDRERRSLGLQSVEETRAARTEPMELLQAIDVERDLLGLTPVAVLRQSDSEPTTLLEQQKADTVSRLSITSKPCAGVSEALGALGDMGTPFAIATTSGKPRVPLCVEAAGLRQHFPEDEHIHSGESDFDPPCFKPAPGVYLRAAESVGKSPTDCIAVEDSIIGVGAAANADIGLIVGYVGGQHISPEMEEKHAKNLMEGARSENGRGADIVITHMFDLPLVVECFARERARNIKGRIALKCCDFSKAAGQLYLRP